MIDMAKGKYWKVPVVYVKAKRGKSKKAIESTEVLAISKEKKQFVILKDRRRLKANPRLKKMSKRSARNMKRLLNKYY